METTLNHPQNVPQSSRRPCNCEDGLCTGLRTRIHWCFVYLLPPVLYCLDLYLDKESLVEYWNSNEIVCVWICAGVKVISFIVGIVYLTHL